MMLHRQSRTYQLVNIDTPVCQLFFLHRTAFVDHLIDGGHFFLFLPRFQPSEPQFKTPRRFEEDLRMENGERGDLPTGFFAILT